MEFNLCPLQKRIVRGTQSEILQTPYANDSDNAWYVNFNNGNVNWNNLSNDNLVRPVRQHSISNSPLVLMFTIEQLWKAYRDCLCKKRGTISALRFEVDRERNLFALLDELRSRTYKISQHICFVINDPTPREIFAADFRDRIVHHLLCNEIASLFEVDFVETSFANRKGKGTHKAVDQLRTELRKGGFFLKLDSQAFFRSINKDVLYRLLEMKLQSAGKDAAWTDEMLWLCETIIFHDPVKDHFFTGKFSRDIIPPSKSLFYSNGTGLPIGNLTSQFFGNVYMNELDQHVRALGFRHVRYVDDFVLFSDSKKALVDAIPKIDAFLKENLRLSIHPKKVILQGVAKGVDFLGYFVKPTHTLVRGKVVSRLKKKIAAEDESVPMLNSYFGHFRHANSFGLRKSICQKMAALHSDPDCRRFIAPSFKTPIQAA